MAETSTSETANIISDTIPLSKSEDSELTEWSEVNTFS